MSAARIPTFADLGGIGFPMATLLTKPGDQASLTLGDGQRLVVIREGFRPQVVEDAPAGQFAVSGDQMDGGAHEFPLLLLVVDLAHVATLRACPPSVSDALIARARQLMRDGSCDCPLCRPRAGLH